MSTHCGPRGRPTSARRADLLVLLTFLGACGTDDAATDASADARGPLSDASGDAPPSDPRPDADAPELDSGPDARQDAAPDPHRDGAAPDATSDAAPDSAPDAAPDAAPPEPIPPWPACEWAGPLDDTLRFNHLQLLGTHNSYHVEPATLIHASHAYTHPPLDVQLDLGVRQFELDVHLRIGEGFEVFHLPRFDEETTCRRLADCLRTIREWSQAHPCHAPIVIWIEPKDEDLDHIDPTLTRFLDRHDELEAAVLRIWPRERILAPDDVRGAFPTLSAAVRTDGWPTLGALRGHIVLSMLDTDNHRAAYLDGAPNLAGRLMFVAADTAEDPFAAMFKINNAARERERVQALAALGFHITSNVDGADVDAEGQRAHLAESLVTAPHAISSDFVVPHPESGYVARLDGPSPGCHPRTAPDSCHPEAIEPRE